MDNYIDSNYLNSPSLSLKVYGGNTEEDTPSGYPRML